MLYILKIIILISLLIAASYTDIKYRKIPNELVIVGTVIGLILIGSLKAFFIQIFIFLFLFMLSALHIMGAGDIKLWMMITVYTGFYQSCIIMSVAALLLCFYAFVLSNREARLILRHMFLSLRTRTKPIIIEQTQYAFAPFICASAILWTIIRLV